MDIISGALIILFGKRHPEKGPVYEVYLVTDCCTVTAYVGCTYM